MVRLAYFLALKSALIFLVPDFDEPPETYPPLRPAFSHYNPRPYAGSVNEPSFDGTSVSPLAPYDQQISEMSQNIKSLSSSRPKPPSVKGKEKANPQQQTGGRRPIVIVDESDEETDSGEDGWTSWDDDSAEVEAVTVSNLFHNPSIYSQRLSE